MSDLANLLEKIDAEIDAAKQRVESFRQEKLNEYHQRQERLETFGKVCDELSEIWKPRLETLASKLGERAEVAPTVTPSLRQALFHVHSPFARVEMAFSAAPDDEIQKLILQYDLEILPILMKFKNTDRLEMPLDQIDRQAIAAWVDDRIVDFVKTYLELHQNEQYLSYLKDYLVEDPISGARFPKYAAAAKCEHAGETCYFIAEETFQEFQKKHGNS